MGYLGMAPAVVGPNEGVGRGCRSLRGNADFGGCRVGAMVWVGGKLVSRLSDMRYLILRERVVGSFGIIPMFTDGLGR